MRLRGIARRVHAALRADGAGGVIEKRGGYTPSTGEPPTRPPPKPSDARQAGVDWYDKLHDDRRIT